jgi:hypothetical protein
VRRWIVLGLLPFLGAACDSRPVVPLDRDELPDAGARDADPSDGPVGARDADVVDARD